MSQELAVARRLSNLVLTDREIEAYDTLLTKAAHVNSREYRAESNEAVDDLRAFTFAELLVAIAGILAGPNDDENRDHEDGDEDIVEYAELRCAAQILRVFIDEVSDNEFVSALIALAQRDPVTASLVGTHALPRARDEFAECLNDDRCMALPSGMYNGVIGTNAWDGFVAQRLRKNKELTTEQISLATTLVPSWHGTGNALVETVQRLRPS